MHFYTPDIFFFEIDKNIIFILKKKYAPWYFFFQNWQKYTLKKKNIYIQAILFIFT
jgi:hypothetical protein